MRERLQSIKKVSVPEAKKISKTSDRYEELKPVVEEFSRINNDVTIYSQV